MKHVLKYAVLIALVFIVAGHATAGLTDDLVVYFTFDNVENKRVLDESGNNLNAQIIKNAVLAKGKYGKAIRITRETEDCVNLPAFDALNINHRITMMAWVYHEDWTETSAQLFDKGCYSRGTNVYGMGVFNKKHHPDIDAFGIDSGIALILANNEVQKSITADNKLQKRVWHHIASTASLDARRIYLNANGEGTGFFLSTSRLTWLPFPKASLHLLIHSDRISVRGGCAPKSRICFRSAEPRS